MKPKHRLVRLSATVALSLLGVGCALSPSQPEVAPIANSAPPAWTTPLPHAGNTSDLAHWWQSLGDPVLVQLIEAAEQVSPTLASATSRVLQSRAALGNANAANRPTLNGSLSGQRGVTASSPTVGTALQSSLDASWEIDLFGANRDAASAAESRLQSTSAQWHEARVSVAGETANSYFGWRTCRKLLAVAQADASSRGETARLAGLSAQVGSLPQP